MKPAFHHRDTCRLCGGTALENVVPLRPIPIATPNTGEVAAGLKDAQVPLDLYLCRDCGHFQLLDIIDPEIQYRNFRYRTTISLGLDEYFQAFACEVVESQGLAAGDLVVEIGSNDGTLLRAFQPFGLRVLGVDPAQEIAARASAAGTPTLARFFDATLAGEILQTHGRARLVVANNTFANLDDLSDVMAGIHTLLTPDGTFVFDTSYGAAVVRETLIDTVYHEHLSYFMARPLVSFFARHGMELIDVLPVPNKGGSIRGIAQLKHGPRPVSPRVAEMVAAELAAGLDRPDPYRAFARRLTEVTDRLGELIAAEHAAGGRVAGYGASVGSVTLVRQFRLGTALDFIADDKPLAETLPAADRDIPVTSSDALYGPQAPSAIVVLAWRYAAPIIARHERYR
ncbi:MAG TPA: class I SAM-dependent methyltransferase, partial [Brevundimonas sp.]|nr:class I SAM-dependent methyltransferase [Brevundimonas sp.]